MAQDLWYLPVKLLLPTKNELGGSLDPDEKDVFGVNAKALQGFEYSCHLPHFQVS